MRLKQNDAELKWVQLVGGYRYNKRLCWICLVCSSAVVQGRQVNAVYRNKYISSPKPVNSRDELVLEN